jgi:membrane protease subunit (stomatin/prohibitin family)
MGLGKWIGGQFIDIIEWTDSNQNEVLAHRFIRQGNEIKNGAKLVVREGQSAGFVKEGQLADIKFPGMYTLDTNNLPVLATILGWKYGFESPFKCEVYFISTRQWTNQKWGTQNPIMYRDPEFGPVRLRGFGNYAFKVTDPGTFLKELVATDPSFELYEISSQFRNVIVSRFVDALGSARIPMLDLAGNYDKVSKIALEKISPELAKMGISLTQFFVENISLPPEVEATLDKRSQMSVLGNLDQYAKMQSADAIRDAAQNPGGLAGMGASLGAGLAVGQQMGGALAGMATAPGVVVPSHTTPPGSASPASAGGTPPPLPGAVAYHVALDGATAGPLDMPALAAHARSGKLTRKTLVWKAGMAAWAAAETVPELVPLFADVPPPLPT